MRSGVIHTKSKKRTYIETHHAHIDSHEHAKHILPGKKKTKILAAKFENHHHHFNIGDKVSYEIHKIDNRLATILYFSLPIIGIITGLIYGKTFATTNAGVLFYMFLFMVLAIAIKVALWNDFTIFKEIEVKIHKPDRSIEVYKAKKKAGKTSKLGKTNSKKNNSKKSKLSMKKK